MIIDGKAIADSILAHLTDEVAVLKSHGITPSMAVIQIGDNPASLAYIRQKQKAAERIGAKLVVSHQSSDISTNEFITLIEKYNNDPNIHGVIVQRPLPQPVGEYHVTIKKDVDGFEDHSPFDVPVAIAVEMILKSIHADFTKKIVIIGRGSTAGAPILHYFDKLHCTTSQIHSKTENAATILKSADIIISCVGKSNVVTSDTIKPGVILVSVGIWRDEAGKLHGDYEPDDIADKASWYTPTPGGVGPVNVACLMQNLVKACSMK